MAPLKNCVAACLAVFLSAQLIAPFEADETNRNVIQFKGRQVDLGAFHDAFPYDNCRWEASLKQNVLYFLKQDGAGLSIYRTKLGADVAPAMLENANQATQADLLNSVTFDWKVSKHDGSLYFKMDEDNNESFNLHAINADGALKRLTNANYVAGYGFSPDLKKLAYAERTGPKGARIRIHVLDLATGLERVVAAGTIEFDIENN